SERASSGSSEAIEDQVIAESRGHANAGGARHRVGPWLGELRPLLESAHDRRAAVRLHRIHARPRRADEADRLQLVERFPHSNEPGSTAGWIDDGVRQAPAEVFSQLEAERLLAFDAVRLAKRCHVKRAGLLGDKTGQLAAVG